MSQQNERAGCDHPDEGPISTADRSSSAVSGDAVVLANNCGLSCTYCGYPDAAVRPVDVPALIDEASLLAKRSASPRRIVGKDPAEHPQFEAVLQSMLRYRSEVSVQSTGLALHRERERWAATQGVRWELPLCSARAEVHDRIVGRPGHHAIVTELLEDPRLAIVVNVLAVRDVLADGNLRELTEYLRKIGRAFVVRLMTPRDSEDVTYYESGIVEPSVLWQALGEALTPQELAGVVLDNVECLPLCTLPEAQQGLYARAFATDMGLDSPRAQTPSLAGLEPCPHEARCGFGPWCLGVHALYLRALGEHVVDPARVTEQAAAIVLTGEGPRETKALLRTLHGVRVAAAREQWAEAARLLLRVPAELASASPLWTGTLDAVRRQARTALQDWVLRHLGPADDEAAALAIELVTELSPQAERPARRRRLELARARKAVDDHDWPRARRLLAALGADELARADPELSRLLDRARRDRLFDQFQEHARRGERGKAAAVLRGILRFYPEDPHATRELSRLEAVAGESAGEVGPATGTRP